MDNKEKQIWQYLDGELAHKRRMEVEQKIATDPSFRASFDATNKMHSNLSTLPLESAPDDMMQHIMSSIADEKIFVAKQTSFSGLKYILGAFGGLNALLFAYLIFEGNISLTPSSSSSNTDYLGKMTAPFEGLQFSVSDVPSNLLPYGLALGLMLGLYWADQIGNKFGNRLRLLKSKV